MISEKETLLVNRIITVISIAMCLFHIYTAVTFPLQAMEQRGIHLGFAFSILFLNSALQRKTALRILDYLLFIAGVVVNVYIAMNWVELMDRMTWPIPLDYFMAILTIILVVDAARRSLGIWMPLIGCLFILYAYIGPKLPGLLNFPGISLRRFVSSVYFSTEGIYGSTLGVSATFVFMFVMYGEFLLHFGAGDFIIKLSQGAFGTVRGGTGKIAVLASALFGMVSGSAVANVAGTGCITIPLMKDSGYDSEYAGGVVASASTGGQIMPPVMGSAAFIMAEMLRMTYGMICIAAIIPAILYYVALFIMVDLRAAKTGLKGLPKDRLPVMKKVLKEGWHYLISIFTLILLLIGLEWSASKAALWSIIALVAADWIKKAITRQKIELSLLVKVFLGSAKGAVAVATATSCAGIIIGVFVATGLNLRFSSMLIALAGGSLFILLVLAAIAAIILGMGLPTTPVYILMSVLAAPALVQMGVVPLAAHMFVFYFGVMAPITPPVGLAFYVSSGIAQSKPMATGFIAWRTALPGFLLPFVFVYNPGLLLQGSIMEILWPVLTSTIGVIALAIGIEGYISKPMKMPLRVLMIIGALMTIIPEPISSYIGFIIIPVVLVLHFLTSKKHPVEVA